MVESESEFSMMINLKLTLQLFLKISSQADSAEGHDHLDCLGEHICHRCHEIDFHHVRAENAENFQQLQQKS